MQITYNFTYYTHPQREPGKTFTKATTFRSATASDLELQVKDHMGHYGVISATELTTGETDESNSQV